MAKRRFFMAMLGLILASAVPVSMYAQNLPDNVVAQAHKNEPAPKPGFGAGFFI
ncbi:MAG: hypothetical protein LBE74_03490 [Treponema sp.]|nr:hypothetical protein [Treponema sp.]